MSDLALILWQPLIVLAGMAIWALLLWAVVATVADRVRAWRRHDKRRAKT